MKEALEISIEPCICGSDKVSICEDFLDTDAWIECQSCKAEGLHAGSVAEAIKIWNENPSAS